MSNKNFNKGPRDKKQNPQPADQQPIDQNHDNNGDEKKDENQGM